MSWKDEFPKENRFLETERGILYCGDCLEIMKNFLDKSIDLILTDPPYQYLDHELDKEIDIDLVSKEYKRVLKNNAFVVLFGRGTSFYRWNVILSELGFKFKEELVWDKGVHTSPYLNIARIHETISIHAKGKRNLNKIYIDKLEYDFNAEDWHKLAKDMQKLISSLKSIKTYEDFENWKKMKPKLKTKKHGVIGEIKLRHNPSFEVFTSYARGILFRSIIRVHKEQRYYQHPTQKPLKLMEYLVRLCSNENELILDNFAGSGSTLIAAEKLNRKWIGIEINEKYCEIAKERLKEHLKQPKLFNGGENVDN